MTREEAIDILQHITTIIPSNDVSMDDVDTALDMAIKALEQNESAEKWYKLFVEKLSQEPKADKPMCDRNICLSNEYNGIGCDECIVNKAEQEPCDVFDEYGNYKYPSDVELTEPNTATSMPCDDAISREAVLKGIEELKKSPWATANRSHGYEYLITEALDVVKDLCVKQLPSVTQKSGKWIPNYYFYGIYDYTCSECEKHSKERSEFCPNCGAKMVEPQERSDKE